MKKYAYGFCGMPCALCSRYRTEGVSRCPGCSAGGYYSDGCKAYACCKERKYENCGLCAEYPCKRHGGMGDFSDLNTNHAKQKNCEQIAGKGFLTWYQDYEKKADLLTVALEKYNNGRMKRYLCELFIQQDLAMLTQIMEQAEKLTGDKKEKAKAKAFKLLAEGMKSWNMECRY